jgi:hypothetical protein
MFTRGSSITQSREYSHNSKCYYYYTVKLILGVVVFLLFYVAKIYSSCKLPPMMGVILVIACYVHGQLYFVILQGYNKGR